MAIKELSYLMTPPEAAAACRVSVGTLRRWVRDGSLPAVTLPSGQYRIRREDLVALMKRDTSS
jgi:excisionase family DNA binding protein